MPLLELTTPEADVYIKMTGKIKTLTHWRMCAFKAESPRAVHLIPGYLEVWLAKCYENEAGDHIEAPGITGPFDDGRIRLEGDALLSLQSRLSIGGLPTFYEMQLSILQTLIECGIVFGTIIPDDWEG